MNLPSVIEFFAGSGLVTEGLANHCDVIWANDISAKKSLIYTANHSDSHFLLEDIVNINGSDLEDCDISWASFPCQDLSLAGKMKGLKAERSGMFWEWLRIMDEMVSAPSILCLENVIGLLSSRNSEDYLILHRALADRGYRVGPMVLDALGWVPQSRRRVFIVAVKHHVDTLAHEDVAPNWLHPKVLTRATSRLVDFSSLVWWRMVAPAPRAAKIEDLLDWDEACFDEERARKLMGLIPPAHRKQMERQASLSSRMAFPGYRRTRNGKQVLELRFDHISGCLRTAEGGSSKQFLILWQSGDWSARLLTPREAARLMGAPEGYILGKTYNESYNAMGDAVVVPVVSHLAKYLLNPIASSSRKNHKSTHDVGTKTQRFRLHA